MRYFLYGKRAKRNPNSEIHTPKKNTIKLDAK
jgi:hypothetical protein